MDKIFSPAQIDYLDSHFVKVNDCNDRHEKSDKEMEEVKMQLAKMETQLGIVLKVCGFIAGGVGTLLIGAIGALIFK